jgi:hypothetical protein
VIENGGPGRDRTDDLFHAMEARSQLRHRPTLARRIPWGSEFQEGTLSILAYRGAIVNAPHILCAAYFEFLSFSFHRLFCHN